MDAHLTREKVSAQSIHTQTKKYKFIKKKFKKSSLKSDLENYRPNDTVNGTNMKILTKVIIM